MTGTTELRVGSSLAYDGEFCTISEIAADAVVLVTSQGRARRVRLVELLKAPGEGGRAQLAGSDEESPETSLWGVLWAAASPEARQQAHDRAAHVREVLTGYRSGSSSIAKEGEPREQYDPRLKLIDRQRAKAKELGIGLRTMQGWCGRYRKFQEPGLLDGRNLKRGTLLENLDARWLSTCEEVLNELDDRAKHDGSIIIGWVDARVDQREASGEFGNTPVKRPKQSTAYNVLGELGRGRNLFDGSTKGKRSIKNRPTPPYGRLSPARPGEYVLLDTNRLNVFGVDPVSGAWESVELTLAFDLYAREVCGLRVSPRSSKSIDVASVLLETMQPFERPTEWRKEAEWPYTGVPENLLVRTEAIKVERFADRGTSGRSGRGAPAASGFIPETIVIDHGKVYVSEHVTNLCARLGVSIQPARVYMPTDKSPLERFFRTIEQLLQELPGYKGSSVDTRGERPEDEIVYTIAQLEQIIREWIATVYHHTPHKSLFDPQLPGVQMTPAQKHSQGVAVAGRIRVPRNRELLLELLPVVMRNFNHYGVEYGRLRYTGPIVAKYQNRSRVITTGQRKWPFSVNPDDVSRIYFHDPADGVWHTLEWERHQELQMPFNLDALEYAKKLVLKSEEEIDVADALVGLLNRLGVSRGSTAKEKLIGARMVAQRDDGALRLNQSSSLFTVQSMLATRDVPAEEEPSLGDELMDGSTEVDAEPTALAETLPSNAEDFYGDVMEDL